MNFELDLGFGEGLGFVLSVIGGDLIFVCLRELSELNIDFLLTFMELNIVFIWDTFGVFCIFLKEFVFFRDEFVCVGFFGSFFFGLGGDLDGFIFLLLEFGWFVI